MLRGLSLRHDGPAVLIVDEASRVRDELWVTISPMLAAAPAAEQILLSTPAGANGEFHRAWNSGEDWERVQITADPFFGVGSRNKAGLKGYGLDGTELGKRRPPAHIPSGCPGDMGQRPDKTGLPVLS